MALADYEPERVEIAHKGKPLLSVRGLCLDDLSILVRAHLVTLNKLFETAKAGMRPDSVFGVSDLFLMDMIHKAPDVIFDIIALACDETEYSETARKLPVGVQFKALQAIMSLTMEDIGGPKALVAFLDKARQSQSLVGELATTL